MFIQNKYSFFKESKILIQKIIFLNPEYSFKNNIHFFKRGWIAHPYFEIDVANLIMNNDLTLNKDKKFEIDIANQYNDLALNINIG